MNITDVGLFTADRFNAIINVAPASGGMNSFSETDQVVYFLVSARCKIDSSCFIDMGLGTLGEKETLLLIRFFEEMEEPEMAHWLRKCCALVKAVGLFDTDTADAPPDEILKELERKLAPYEQKFRESDGLWNFDEKLAARLRRDGFPALPAKPARKRAASSEKSSHDFR